jgi:hypothetical protein
MGEGLRLVRPVASEASSHDEETGLATGVGEAYRLSQPPTRALTRTRACLRRWRRDRHLLGGVK